MKIKTILLSLLICLSGLTYAQKKKTAVKKKTVQKNHIPAVKQESEVLQIDPGTSNVQMSMPMVESPKQISLHLIDGEMLTARRVSELTGVDLKALKSVTIDNKYTPELDEEQLSVFIQKLLSESPNLEELNLRNSKIKALPTITQANAKLKKLDISNNELESMPVGLENFPNLEQLVINDNQLKALPASLASLKKLKDVDFSNNPIDKALFMPSLSFLKFKGILRLHKLNLTKKEYEAVKAKLKLIEVYH